MSFRKDFQAFLFRGNVVDLAVAVVIGAAFNKIVTAFVSDLVMPVVSVFLPQGGWRQWTFTPVAGMELKVGDLLATLIDFLVIAFVVFLVLVKFLGKLKHKEAPPPAPATKTCPECAETVLAAARKCKYCTSAIATFALLVFTLVAGGRAYAQDTVDPKFAYGKAEPPAPDVGQWKAQAKGGLLLTGGNAQSTSANIGASASYKQGSDRVSLEGAAAYVNASVRYFYVGMDDQGRARIGSFDDSRTTSNQWLGRARYDRFFTTNNSGYLSGQALEDKPAGKQIAGGAQIGYSRQLLHDDINLIVAELGYDFSYEKSTAEGAQGVAVQSGRAFVSETLTLTKETGLTAGLEVLTNLNHEKEPKPGYQAYYGSLGPFKDTRVNAKLTLATTLWKNVSFGFGTTLRYDNRPALLAVPSSLSAVAFPPRARRLDMLTEANLIVTFL